MSPTVAVILLLVAGAFGVFLWLRLPNLMAARTGRLMLLVTLFALPLLLVQVGVSHTLTGSKQKAFCTSCHEMQVYDTSLHIDDPEFLPAQHFQNRRIPQETACYTCHTDYTMYGDIEAKLSGLKHVAVHYFGDVPPPGEVKLYKPYHNDNCLQCHRGARRFEKKAPHSSEGVTLELLYQNEKSCVAKGCHDKVHDIAHLGKADLFGEPPFPVPDILKQRAAKETPALEDPFAEDPFANEAPDAGSSSGPDASSAPDAGGGGAPGDRPATAIDNVDDLWADEDAGTPADAANAPDATSTEPNDAAGSETGAGDK